MLKDGGGVNVNVDSIHGEQCVEWMPVKLPWTASRPQGVALEYAPEVRANAIAPGEVPVERTAAAFENSQVVDIWFPYLPIGDIGTVQQVAEAAIPLCTNAWTNKSILISNPKFITPRINRLGPLI